MANVRKTSLILVILCLLLLGGGAMVIMLTMNSPKTRRVDVAPPLQVTSPVPPPATVTFSNGTIYELIAITDTPDSPSRWWSADGTPVTAPSPLPATRSRPQAGAAMYELMIRMTSPQGENDSSWSITLEGPKILSTAIGNFGRRSFKPGDPQPLAYYFETADQPATANLRIKLGNRELAEVIRADLRSTSTASTTTPTTTTAPSAQPAAVFEKIADGPDGNAEVAVRFSSAFEKALGDVDAQAILIDAAGKQHMYEDTRSPRTGGTVFRFAIPRRQAVTFVYRYRSWQKRQIRNISLQPGVQTVVKIEPPPLVTPPR